MRINNYSKYKNKKIEVDGKVFDSKKEADRYKELKLCEMAGVIKDLKTQVKYELIPPQKDKDGKSLERSCTYIADFVYEKDGETIVEDTKGFKTPEYIIKRKLMLKVHGIRIKEV